MLFGKSVSVLFFKNTSLDLFTDKGAEKDTLTLPKDLVKNLAIKDKEEFKQLVLDFFARNSLKNQKILLILSEDVTIQKSLGLLTEEKKKKEEEEFVKDIKVEEEKQLRMVLADEKNTYFLATSKDLIDPLNEALNNVGSQLLMVVPISLFANLSEKNVITTLEAGKILENIKALKFGDFLTQGEEVVQKQSVYQVAKPEKEDKLFSLDFLVIFLAIMVTTALIVFIGLITGVLDVRIEKFQSLLGSSPSPTLAPTPTPTEVPIEAVSKKELKIQVLNGTGTPGQAGKARDLLKESEFKNVEVADAEEQSEDREKTEIVYSLKVSDKDFKEIVTLLEDNFASVSAKVDKQLSDFDVVITTGAAK